MATTDWFTTFVGELETAATAIEGKIVAVGEKLGGEIFQYAPGAIGKMAQFALDAVLKQVGIDIPGEQKFGQAVADYIEQVEINLGFLPAQPDAHAAVQAAYTKAVSKAKGG